MKKTLLIAALALMAGAATAQQNKVSWGIKASYTFAKISASVTDPTFGSFSGNSGNLKSFGFGAFAEIYLGPKGSFQPGISYVRKGGTSITDDTDFSSGETVVSHDKTNFDYLEVPLNFLYNVPLKSGKVFIGMGPYLAMGLSAKNKTDVTSASGNTSSSSQSITFGSGVNELKRMDLGINALAGFRFDSGLEIGGGMGFGLSNLSNVSSVKTHNQTISISAGYFF
jgi:hypothetical protein